jgi:hypothetical protein
MSETIYVGLFQGNNKKSPLVKYNVQGDIQTIAALAHRTLRGILLLEADGCFDDLTIGVHPMSQDTLDIIEPLHQLMHCLWTVRADYDTFGSKIANVEFIVALVEFNVMLLGSKIGRTGNASTDRWTRHEIWQRLCCFNMSNANRPSESELTADSYQNIVELLRDLYVLYAEAPIDEYISNKFIYDPIKPDMEIFVSNKKELAWTAKAFKSNKALNRTKL